MSYIRAGFDERLNFTRAARIARDLSNFIADANDKGLIICHGGNTLGYITLYHVKQFHRSPNEFNWVGKFYLSTTFPYESLSMSI